MLSLNWKNFLLTDIQQRLVRQTRFLRDIRLMSKLGHFMRNINIKEVIIFRYLNTVEYGTGTTSQVVCKNAILLFPLT